MKKNLSVLIVFTFCLISAQNYTPIDTADYRERQSFLETYKKESEIFNKKQRDKYQGKTGRDLSGTLSDYQKSFQEDVKSKNFVFNTPFNHYLTQTVNRVLTGNALVFTNLRVLVAKETSPNAFCTGDGTLVVNMGLFNWVDNQDQLASVICHELGHLFLEHYIKLQIEAIAMQQNNKEEAKKLLSVKNNKGEKAYAIFKNQLYRYSAKRRVHEQQADSLGYVLFRQSGFAKPEFKKALLNLKKYDTISPKILKTEMYRQFFDLPNHPFKEDWLQKEDFSTYNYSHYKEKIDKDSVASHPEIDLRTAYLDRQFPEQKTPSAAVNPSEEYLKLEKIAKMEILPNFYQSEDYGVGIYSALQLLQEDDSDYYKSWLGKNFEKIYDARKNYKLNRYLDRVDPKNQTESYQQFLNFMWNLSLDDLKYISEFYNKKSL